MLRGPRLDHQWLLNLFAAFYPVVRFLVRNVLPDSGLLRDNFLAEPSRVIWRSVLAVHVVLHRAHGPAGTLNHLRACTAQLTPLRPIARYD